MGLLEPYGRSRRPVRRTELTAAAAGAVVVVHSLAHAVAALAAAAEAGACIILLSAPGAALYAGPGWWRAMVEAARTAVPATRCTAILDCADDAGAAQAAIRVGAEAIVFTGPPDVAERLIEIAAQTGIKVITKHPAATLDLADFFFADAATLQRRCAEALARPQAASRDRM